jgi:hypothetical protein
MRFRKKPVVIQARRLVQPVAIVTPEGTMHGRRGDWLITGIKGERYPCAHDVFLSTYEPADQDAAAYLERAR